MEAQFSPHLPSPPNSVSAPTSTPAVRTPPTPNNLPDIVLQTVNPEVEKSIFSSTKYRDGRPRSDDYALMMFMMIVDFPTYPSWAQKVNWKGLDGKQGLPRNVIKLKKLLQHYYKDISSKEWKDIRDRVNERLRNPKTFFLMKKMYCMSRLVSRLMT